MRHLLATRGMGRMYQVFPAGHLSWLHEPWKWECPGLFLHAKNMEKDIKLTTVSVTRFFDVWTSAWSKSIRAIDDLCLGSLIWSRFITNSHRQSTTYLASNRWPINTVGTDATSPAGTEFISFQTKFPVLISRWRIFRSRKIPLHTRWDSMLQSMVAGDVTHLQVDHIMHKALSEACQYPWTLSLYPRGQCESWNGPLMSSVCQRIQPAPHPGMLMNLIQKNFLFPVFSTLHSLITCTDEETNKWWQNPQI